VSTAIIIPARDEERCVAAVVNGARSALPEARVIVVDDASSDGTAAAARAAGAHVVPLAVHAGYAGALRAGYHAALASGADVIAQMDADGQHRPGDLPALLAALPGADLVLGSRFLGADPGYTIPRLRRVGMVACRWMGAVIGGLPITDPTSGLRVLTAPVARHLAHDGFPSGLTETSLLIHLHRRGLRIREVPVRMHAPTGPSMHRGVGGGLHMLRISWAVLGLAADRRVHAHRGRDMDAPMEVAGEVVGTAVRPL
jgi:hypothetical protein